MQTHWIHAHPAADSLNARLFKAGTQHLCGLGHHVITSDLYDMNWNPIFRQDDFGRARAQGGTVTEQSHHAFLTGEIAADIRVEQEKLAAADLLIIQFPLWWYGMPAILKGWFDRVFVKGFAFGVKDPATGRTLKYGEGGLAGKRALIITTAGDRASSFEARGINGDIESLLFPILHGTFWYTGMAPLRPHLIPAVDAPGWEGASGVESELLTRLAGLPDEEPIPYRAMRSGDYDAARKLKPEILPGQTGIGVHTRTAPHPAPTTSPNRPQ
ncbi:NAD(P)H-dependent oxidoreductase [Hoyosella altamirensis]|uniref:NAD(P)H dehydrogenase (Quinone) n=1 Tax=Hoyosella altamirensis TaxID=616997 RepID=A0A839RH74_9ACTN|nr:NAD(P)H-dependent oxidoreductase [Hoyosella altamirensis]MBB3035737.1 NAD(P)H dehydrogenase (quinone) [Hoyosella altamirensis]